MTRFQLTYIKGFKAPLYTTLWVPMKLERDQLTRLLYGGRVSLLVALIASCISTIIGTLIGISAGYFGGWYDTMMMRITDSIIALPLLHY